MQLDDIWVDLGENEGPPTSLWAVWSDCDFFLFLMVDMCSLLSIEQYGFDKFIKKIRMN